LRPYTRTTIPAVRYRLAFVAWLFGLIPSSVATIPPPVVVELFTSEGCSSCPPADALLQQLANAASASGPEIIALGEHVDYWDHQGWKDRFSSAALTNRQQRYAARFNNESIYTPQMVVDGRVELVGSDAKAARRAIDRAAAAPHGVVRIAIESNTNVASQLSVIVNVSDLPAIARGDRADMVVAITEDHLTSDVKRGENHGRVLTHAAVVRRLTTIGDASAPASSARAELVLEPDWQRDRLKIVAFVQERRSRTILASAAFDLSMNAKAARVASPKFVVAPRAPRWPNANELRGYDTRPAKIGLALRSLRSLRSSSVRSTR